ncbi:MAG: NYN domain-containing protein [Patescibacteria group bacterium]
MPAKKENNFAFIDSANLHLGIKQLGWRLNYARFRTYLAEKYAVKRAYMFIGYNPDEKNLHQNLQACGYILDFKPTLKLRDGKIKGNCDAELVLRCMIDLPNYDKAVVVAGDGDYHCLIKHLKENDKLEKVIAPSPQGCSVLLTRLMGQGATIDFLSEKKSSLEYTG